MNENMLYETLKKLSDNQRKREQSERKPPMKIYKDEKTGQIKEEPLSQSDMAASAYFNTVVKQYKNPAKELHQFIFGH